MMWVDGAGREREELGKAETLAVWDSGTLGGVARRRGTGDGGRGCGRALGRHGGLVPLQQESEAPARMGEPACRTQRAGHRTCWECWARRWALGDTTGSLARG